MTRRGQRLRGFAAAQLVLLLLPLGGLAQARARQGADRATPAQLEAAREYVRRGWRTLRHSNRDLASAAVERRLRAQMPEAVFRRVGLRFGYTSNEIGFGWTNAAFTELSARLPPAARAKVLGLGGVGSPHTEHED